MAGTGTAGYNGDGIAATSAQLYYPFGVTFDASGNMYIADRYNHRIRKVDVATGLISTVAGTGMGGYNGDGIAATSAQLNYPYDVTFDASGNMYIADDDNNRIRKVDGVVVPIELLSFNAIAENNKLVRTEWSTASEINNDYFLIQRSKNAHDYEIIGQMDGAGNSNTVLNYVFYDNEPYTGISYYRLKQVDYNGQFTYSDIRSVYIGTINIISIYPNPASDFIQYEVGSEAGGAVTITLYDVLGREVFSKEETISAGIFKEKISTVGFSSGNYLLRITNGNKEKTQKQFVVK